VLQLPLQLAAAAAAAAAAPNDRYGTTSSRDLPKALARDGLCLL